MTKPYMFSGIALAIIGFILAPVSYFIIKSVFVTSIGISILILGPTCIGLAYTEMRNTGVKGIIVRIQNILLISLALTFSVIDILLALSNQHDITVYFILNAIVYFIISWVFVALNPKLRTAVISTGLIVFTGFLITMVVKIIENIK